MKNHFSAGDLPGLPQRILDAFAKPLREAKITRRKYLINLSDPLHKAMHDSRDSARACIGCVWRTSGGGRLRGSYLRVGDGLNSTTEGKR
jgi:hypothetical protein